VTKIVKLKKICSLIKRGITPKYTENDGIIVINQRCIRDGIILYKNARKHDIVNKKIPEDKKIIAGDVLINSTGVGTLGRVSQIYPISEMTVDSHVTIVRANPSDVDLAYFGYYLKLLQPSFEASGEGSTGQTELARERIGEHEIILPLKSEQVKIGKLLSNIDDLIQNNKIKNETFEEMARVIFKSWFVDFDPVHAKAAGKAPMNMNAETAALFPNSFSDDGLPIGWSVKTLGDLILPKRGKTITKSKTKYGTIPVVAGGLEPAYYHNEANVESPVITISASGANAGFTRLYYENIWASDCSYISKQQTDAIYFWFVFLETNQRKIYHMQQGAAQPHIYPSDLMRLELAVPNNKLIQHFENLVTPYFQKISIAQKESKTLTELRDTLLPKLMSGEIRVKDAEREVETAV